MQQLSISEDRKQVTAGVGTQQYLKWSLRWSCGHINHFKVIMGKYLAT